MQLERTRRTPPREFSSGMFPRGKHPRIYQCIFYISFIKNEAWNCNRKKFSFPCFLCFVNLFKLWICGESCKYRLGKFNCLWTLPYHLCLFTQIDAFKRALQKLLVLIKKLSFSELSYAHAQMTYFEARSDFTDQLFYILKQIFNFSV